MKTPPHTRGALLAVALFTVMCAHAHAHDGPPMEQRLSIWRMVGAMRLPEPDGPIGSADRVIRDRQEFDRLWKRTHANSRPAPEVPPIDFSREMVIVLSLGGLTPSGTDVTGEQIIEFNDVVQVRYSVVSAGKNCTTLPSFAAVIWVLRTKRLDKPVTFAKDWVVRDCK